MKTETTLSTPEVIAYLDTFEAELRAHADRMREFRYMLFETLDSDPDALVD